MTKDKYKSHLTEKQLYICDRCGTEPPFSGKYYDHKEKGTYACVACKTKLFTSEDKFDSGTGWPSYMRAIEGSVKEAPDGTGRIEVRCKTCDSHLGHVFPDGPPPTGQRFCINSEALEFVPCPSQ